jgi:signal transduction histidine kinase
VTHLPSIRQRLSRTLVAISLVWGVAVSVVLWLAVRHEVDELLDNTLQESAEILYGLISFNVAQLPMQRGDSMPAPQHVEQTVWQIVDDRNAVLLKSHHAPAEPLVAHHTPGFSSSGRDWRVYGIGLQAGNRILYVAQRGDARREARAEAAVVTVAGALVVGVLCTLWMRRRVRHELLPILDMSSSVKRFDPVHADFSLAEATRAELVPLHDAIRDLGDRLAQRMANERAFAAHAAHALRTPLAGMVAQLAVAQKKASPEIQPHLRRTREAANRLRRVVTALLALFRAGGDAQWQNVDLADLVAQLPFEKLKIITRGPRELIADPDLLAAALMNLLENSERHGATHAVVTASHGTQGAFVIVSDDGVGIGAEKLALLQKALSKRNYGSPLGLGLTLADLVAHAHGGRLCLQSSTEGFSAQLQLGIPPRVGTFNDVRPS